MNIKKIFSKCLCAKGDSHAEVKDCSGVNAPEKNDNLKYLFNQQLSRFLMVLLMLKKQLLLKERKKLSKVRLM